MNKKQKIILAIFIPVIVLFITLMIANSVGITYFGGYGKHIHDPFDWEKTWYVWIACFIIIFISEYKLFSDKNVSAKNKKGGKIE